MKTKTDMLNDLVAKLFIKSNPTTAYAEGVQDANNHTLRYLENILALPDDTVSVPKEILIDNDGCLLLAEWLYAAYECSGETQLVLTFADALDDDGTLIHGMHFYDPECKEEGVMTIACFPVAAHLESLKAGTVLDLPYDEVDLEAADFSDDTVSVPSEAMVEAACDALTESGGAIWVELSEENKAAFRPRMCAALIAAQLESL